MRNTFFIFLSFLAIFIAAQPVFSQTDPQPKSDICGPCCGSEDCKEGLICVGAESGCDLEDSSTKSKWGECQKPGEYQICNPLSWSSIDELISSIFNWLVKIALIITPIMVVIGGVILMTAGGNPEKVKTGKRIIFWTLTGFLIILFAHGIKNIVEYIIGVK